MRLCLCLQSKINIAIFDLSFNGIPFDTSDVTITVTRATTDMSVVLDEDSFPYGGPITEKVEIAPEFDGATIYECQDGSYNANAPVGSVSGDTTFTIPAQNLSAGKYDYIAVYAGSDNMTAATEKVSVRIVAKDIAAATVSDDIVVTYDAEEQTPEISVFDESLGKMLIKDQDYRISYSKNRNAGTAKFTVTGIGNYTGTKEGSFKINPAPITVVGTQVEAENVTLEDEERLTDAIEDLENALNLFGDAYTEEEKKAIEDEIARLEDLEKQISKVNEIIEGIQNLPDNIKNSADASKVEDREKRYDVLSEKEKEWISDNLVSKLQKAIRQKNAYLKSAKADNSILNTGDASNIFGCIILIAIIFTGLIFLFTFRRKHHSGISPT